MSTEQSRLDALKATCVEGESDEAHASHAEDLARAYSAFAGRSESNPAQPGVTELTAELVVTSEDPLPDAVPPTWTEPGENAGGG